MSAHPPLRDALADYLALRRALGFKLANAARLLGQFVDYLHGHGVDTPTTDHAAMTCDTAAPSPPCWTGTAPMLTCRPCCRAWRSTWATPTPSTRSGTCRPRRSCWPWPASAWTPTWQANHEHPRPDPAVVFNRPPVPAASGQRPHHRRLP